MTAQAHELLIIEGERTSMASCPPIPKKHPHIKLLTDEEIKAIKDLPMVIFSTACWRQYIATWELKDGRLYLVDIKGIFAKTTDHPIFADWVDCELRITSGDVLRHVHMGFETVYEFENYIKIEDGIVIEERRVDNRDSTF